MTDRSRCWVLLAYRLPREPSTSRVALWRKLRRLGAVQLSEGVAALPYDARSHEHLGWLADEVVEAGGRASVWIAQPTSAAQERSLAAAMARSIAAEYRRLIQEALGCLDQPEPARRRTLARLGREIHRISSRDFFPPPEREQAQAALARLAVAAQQEMPTEK